MRYVMKAKTCGESMRFSVFSSSVEDAKNIVRASVIAGLEVEEVKAEENQKERKCKKIRIKYARPDIPRLKKIPQGDWIDLCIPDTITMRAGEYKMVSLGVCMELPEGYEAHIVPRSSIFKNYNVIIPNSIGIIDNSYCGDADDWKLLLYMPKGQHVGDGFSELKVRTIQKGSRLCQFRIFKKQPEIIFKEVESLGNENRGGIGSTGTSCLIKGENNNGK